MYNNSKIVLALLVGKLFCSFGSVFELNRGLRDSQTSMNNEDLGLLVKKKADWGDRTTMFILNYFSNLSFSYFATI